MGTGLGDFIIRNRYIITLLDTSNFQRGSYKLCEINIGVCPQLEFGDITLIYCPGYDSHIYGEFEFVYNSIVNL